MEILATPSPKLDPTKDYRSPGSFQFLTAKVQQESPADEFVGILPSEDVETAMAQAVTLTETDVGRETCQVITQTLIESLKGTPLTPLFPRFVVNIKRRSKIFLGALQESNSGTLQLDGSVSHSNSYRLN